MPFSQDHQVDDKISQLKKFLKQYLENLQIEGISFTKKNPWHITHQLIPSKISKTHQLKLTATRHEMQLLLCEETDLGPSIHDSSSQTTPRSLELQGSHLELLFGFIGIDAATGFARFDVRDLDILGPGDPSLDGQCTIVFKDEDTDYGKNTEYSKDIELELDVVLASDKEDPGEHEFWVLDHDWSRQDSCYKIVGRGWFNDAKPRYLSAVRCSRTLSL